MLESKEVVENKVEVKKVGFFQRSGDWIQKHYGESWLPILGALLGGVVSMVLIGWGFLLSADFWFVKRYHNKYPTYRFVLNLLAIVVAVWLVIAKYKVTGSFF